MSGTRRGGDHCLGRQAAPNQPFGRRRLEPPPARRLGTHIWVGGSRSTAPTWISTRPRGPEGSTIWSTIYATAASCRSSRALQGGAENRLLSIPCSVQIPLSNNGFDLLDRSKWILLRGWRFFLLTTDIRAAFRRKNIAVRAVD